MKINSLYTSGIIALIAMAPLGCATKRPAGDVILSTSDGTNKTPAWVHSRPYAEEEGRIFVSGLVYISGDQNPARGMAAADLQARAELAKQIRTRLSNQVQFANEGFGYDNQVLDTIITQGSEVSHLSDVRITHRGFSKIFSDNEKGGRVVYECYSRASIDSAYLKRMIEQSLAEAEGKGRISESFRKKVDKEWDRFFNEGAATPSPAPNQP